MKAALSEIATIHGGGRLRLSGRDFVPQGVPAFGAGGQNGFLAVAEYDRPGVILSSIGARCGKCFYATGQWTSLANTQVILPDLERVDPRFLWYQLDDESRWPRSGTGQPFIKPSDVKSHQVWLPRAKEQRRIAAILDHADSIRVAQRRRLADVDGLVEAQFRSSFGSETSAKTVADVAQFMRTGPFGSQLLHSEFVDDGIAVLGLDNVVGNRFRWAGRRFITASKYALLKRYTVYPRDVLISIMGTTGRCVVVPDDIPVAINTKHICAITVDSDCMDPEFLRAIFLWHPHARAHLWRQTKGSIMDGLNMAIIKAMPVPIPPLERQRGFAKHCARIAEQRAVVAQETAQIAELFASLQARAFSGRL